MLYDVFGDLRLKMCSILVMHVNISDNHTHNSWPWRGKPDRQVPVPPSGMETSVLNIKILEKP